MNGKLKHLDAFAGCGGFTFAADSFRDEIQTTFFIENDTDAIAVLEDVYPDIPIHRDIRDFHCYKGQFNLITAGFPCTGTSNAGTRTGLNHPESALWKESIRILIECRPRFFVIEQPTGVITRGLRAILGAIRMVGYKSEIEIVTASELGAGHRRERLFVVSYPDGLFRHISQSWSEQIGAMVEEQQAHSSWLTVKRDRLCPNNGISYELVSSLGRERYDAAVFTCPTRTEGRIRARKLAGRTVTPAQAAIALKRVLYLNSLI